MQKFKFANDRGEIVIAKGSPYIFNDYDFGGSAAYQREDYADTDGDEIVSAVYDPRTITIDGHIIAGTLEERFHLRRMLYRVMDGKTAGTLTYENDAGIWTIRAVPRLPTVGKPVTGALISPAVFEFEAPSFYWTAASEKVAPLYRRRDLITFPFSLPAVWTERLMSAEVVNDGSLDAPPVIIINGEKAAASEQVGPQEVTPPGITITVTNAAGDTKRLILNYSPEEAETVTIDCDAMTVTGDIGGNLIRYVDVTSDFPVVSVGKNTVTMTNTTGRVITAIMKWHDREAGV